MKKPISWMCLLAFFFASIADLVFIVGRFDQLRIFSKCLLMPLLAVYVWASIGFDNRSVFFISGLLFAAAGDFFLLHNSGFIFGLCCFLLTHILYIVYFAGIQPLRKLGRPTSIPVALAVLLYVGFILGKILPHAGAVSVAVTLYASVIGLMLVSVINALPTFNSKLRLQLLAGAIFFVVSDSLLAYDKFVSPVCSAGFLVMYTYILAQFLLAITVVNRK